MTTTNQNGTYSADGMVRLNGAEDVRELGPRPETFVALDQDGGEVYRSGYRAVAEHFARLNNGTVRED
jgi:hypothetical protein